MAEISKDINKALGLLSSNQVIGLPTETVYGLAGNAFDENAVLKIFEVKQRPKFDPLIVHTSSFERIKEFTISVPKIAEKLFERFSPGPLTILLSKKDVIPDLVTSGLSQVAVRIPNHPLALEVLSKLPFPLAAPSANPFGYISPTSAQHVQDQLGNSIPMILDGGNCSVGVESTIIGFEGETAIVYRLGGLSIEEIEKVTGTLEIRESSSSPTAPGMLKSHYAPKKPFYLGDIDELVSRNLNKKIGILSYSKSYPSHLNYVLTPMNKFSEATINLFNYLRLLDHSDVDIIISELAPNENLGLAINDRLKRAAY